MDKNSRLIDILRFNNMKEEAYATSFFITNAPLILFISFSTILQEIVTELISIKDSTVLDS